MVNVSELLGTEYPIIQGAMARIAECSLASAVSEAGAKIYNIIPLIPQHEFADIPEPTCPEIDGARVRAEKYIDVFRHCQRCRADAVGVPGESEYGNRVYQRRVVVRDTFSHG